MPQAFGQCEHFNQIGPFEKSHFLVMFLSKFFFCKEGTLQIYIHIYVSKYLKQNSKTIPKKIIDIYYREENCELLPSLGCGAFEVGCLWFVYAQF
jgi:hypothetical protein